MYDVDYQKWADYIEEIFRKRSLNPSLVLDLGCGTGSICVEMSKRGYSMIGVDVSVDMLSCANDKALKSKSNVLFLNQDMRRLSLNKEVDVVLCLMDSVNYITDISDIKKVFSRIAEHLKPGGLFIFDINSQYKFENILNDNVFYDLGDDISYIWENRYDSIKQICEFDITFFTREGELYRKWEELHYERAYSEDDMKKLIINSGLKLLNIYEDLTFEAPTETAERIFFVCQK